MIKEQLDGLIKEAMKTKQSVMLDVVRAVKTAFMEHETAKNATPLDDATELSIIRKMVKERKDVASVYASAGRDDLAEKEIAEAAQLELLFVPAEPSREDVEAAAREIVVDNDKKNMGGYIKTLKAKFPAASGQMISDVVKMTMAMLA